MALNTPGGWSQALSWSESGQPGLNLKQPALKQTQEGWSRLSIVPFFLKSIKLAPMTKTSAWLRVLQGLRKGLS